MQEIINKLKKFKLSGMVKSLESRNQYNVPLNQDQRNCKISISVIPEIIERGLKMSRKIYDKNFKAKVALEALKEEKTLSELSVQYGVNPNVISRWKREVLENLPEIFSKKREKESSEFKSREEELYKEIGKLKVENEFLKKKYNQLFKF